MSKLSERIKPVVLIIMDGWGESSKAQGNAIKLAKLKAFPNLWRSYPHTTLRAHGEYVGLPVGTQGNSEVGHLNMGSGRIIYHPLVKINKAIKDKTFFKNKELLAAVRHCKARDSTLHLMGLVQDQTVHANQEHLFAILELCRKERFKDVLIHFFSDGRDSPPKSAQKNLTALEKAVRMTGVGRIATVMGRYYAMDRDNRWDRTEKAYNALIGNAERTAGTARTARTAKEAIAKAYSLGETDEFIKPTTIGNYNGIKKGDSIIFFNYRLDRARQITKAFVEKSFKEFKRKSIPDLYYVCMTEYYKDVPAHVAFKNESMSQLLGEVLARNGLKQLRISETEKYAHVTFFFNGQIEKPNKGEDRVLIPSPKVPTYDLQPEMSAYEITQKLVAAVRKGRYNVIICNLVNCDMVGHTGVMPAVIRAVETVDKCVGEITDAVLASGGAAFLTADHGNAELKRGKKGEILTAHTTSDVPFILVTGNERFKRVRLRKGILADIAPTMLELLGIKKPKEMTGSSLILH
jgi:2,3-bisphosphoglycerate-independent phosphoglycerate mutase